MDRPVPDHRGPEMPGLVAEIRAGLRTVFKSERGEPVIVEVAAERLNLALGSASVSFAAAYSASVTSDRLNELEVLATLAGRELALKYSGQHIELGVGVAAAQRYFAECV